MSEQTKPMVNFTINGRAISVPKGTTIYQASTQLGIEIPIFCYMDRMPPFGACRMCLVEVEKMAKLQASCTLEATEGMVVRTQSEIAVKGREEILEFLLINHPLDCPICDRGGECPLQEQALHHGPGLSRFFEEKRHFTKPWPLGPVLMLDRERCIVCARCTRFGELIAGDHALEMKDRGYQTQVGTPDGGPAQSKFIGNTIMICPVGALTSRVYRFRARPWDNEPTNSTCSLCPVGCSMILDSRDGEIMRTRSLENRDVNDVWMCDKGWFGYEFTNNDKRLQQPLIRKNGRLEPASWEEALTRIANQIQAMKSNGQIAGWGGNPLTVEENYLFQKLLRQGIGVPHVDHRIGMPIFNLDQEGMGPGTEMAIGDCEKLSFAIFFGLDLTEEFPVIWLRLRQAINRGAKVFFFGNFAPEIAPYLAKITLHAPGTELEVLKQYLPALGALAQKGKQGAIFVGRQYLANIQRSAILAELLAFQQAHANLTLNIMEGRGNSVGARLAGMHPELGPLNQRLAHPGLDAIQVLEKAAAQGWDLLYVAGANPAKQFPSKLWQNARSRLKFLVVQDLFLTDTAQQADVVLPTLSYVEKGGSFINIEGRVQILQPGKEAPANLYSDGDIFMKLAQKLGIPLTVDGDFSSRLQAGKRLPLGRPSTIHPALMAGPIASGGSLAATFAHALFDQGVRMKHDSHLIQLAHEPYARLNPHEATKRKILDGGAIRINANGNVIQAKVKWDDQVAVGTIVLPLGFENVPVHDLEINLLNGLALEIQSL